MHTIIQVITTSTFDDPVPIAVISSIPAHTCMVIYNFKLALATPQSN